MLGAALLGGLKGGANAVNTLSEERRRQLAEQLRLETMDMMQQRQQERGFRHAEGMAWDEREFKKGESEASRTHAEGLFTKGQEGEDRRLGTRLTSAETLFTKGETSENRRHSERLASQERIANIKTEKPPEYSSETIDGEIYWINKSNPNDRHRLGPAAGEKLSPQMQESFWDAAGKQARGELGTGFLGIGGASETDLNKRRIEIFNEMLKSTGKKGDPPVAPPDPTAQTVNPATPGLLSPEQVTKEKAKPTEGGFNFQDFVPQSQPAPTSAGPQSSAAPNKMQSAIAAADQANPLLSGTGGGGDGLIPKQEAPRPEAQGVSPTKAMQSRVAANPAEKEAALKQAKEFVNKVKKEVLKDVATLSPSDQDWAINKILDSAWNSLTDNLKAMWKSYDEFVGDLLAGQKDARKALGLGR